MKGWGRRRGERARGETADPDAGKQEEPVVVDHAPDVGVPRRLRPADVEVARPVVPGGGADGEPAEGAVHGGADPVADAPAGTARVALGLVRGHHRARQARSFSAGRVCAIRVAESPCIRGPAPHLRAHMLRPGMRGRAVASACLARKSAILPQHEILQSASVNESQPLDLLPWAVRPFFPRRSSRLHVAPNRDCSQVVSFPAIAASLPGCTSDTAMPRPGKTIHVPGQARRNSRPKPCAALLPVSKTCNHAGHACRIDGARLGSANKTVLGANL